MKKLIVLLLALAFVGLAVYADDMAAPTVQFSDSFSTGIMYNSPADFVSLYDFWDNGYVLYNDLDLSFTAGNFGWFAEFDTTDATKSGQPTFDALSAYAKFGPAKLEVGKTSNGDFTTLGDVAA
ncbi:MAG TPA: hypothetical protein VMC79_13925, partial [Rectinemataceae bacterium]|nr:hypothetical protein [Rectinemataceae bacterium]